MSDQPDPMESVPPEDLTPGKEVRKPKNPASTLTSALVVYVFVNLFFALPLVIFPATYFDLIGFHQTVASQLAGLRWVGAVLLAWSITGIAVLARPEGRGVFVTAGATQLTLGALGFLYSWSIDEYHWDMWYQALASILMTAGAVYLWWARLSGRKVLSGKDITE
ncbi:MAG: hypothetical protein GY926_15435 [bacterium]|nr:hypothetical protein [bacterium]